MKKATIIRDKISGQPFAILLPTDAGKIIAFGSIGQGELWADWAMASSTDMLDNLDVSLAVEKDVELTDDFINSLDKTFSATKINDLKFAISKKAILVIQQTKSLQDDGSPEYEKINEENEAEDISNWPIVDVAIATIDVAYKQAALDYKAKAFNLDSKRSSILLQAKGVRAMWDPNMPGGGGWRCPEETPYGGQFTNRLGRGCTFGMVRRIGRALMTASLGDITKGFDDDKVRLPSAYRAGKKLDEVGDKIQKQKGQKYARRAARRASQLQKEKARKLLKEGRPTFRQRYESLGPTVSRRNRVLIAAAQTARDYADDVATNRFVAESRTPAARERQRQRVARNISIAESAETATRRFVEESRTTNVVRDARRRASRRQGLPTPKNQGDGNSRISGRMTAEYKEQLEQMIRDSVFENRGWKKQESTLFNPLTDDMSNVGNPIWPRYVTPEKLTSHSRYTRGAWIAEVFTQEWENPLIVNVWSQDTGATMVYPARKGQRLDEVLSSLEDTINEKYGDLPKDEGAKINDREIKYRRSRDNTKRPRKPLDWEKRTDSNGDVTHVAVGHNPLAVSGDSIYTISAIQDQNGMYTGNFQVDAIHGYSYIRDGGTNYDEEYFDEIFSNLTGAKIFVQALDESRYRPEDDMDYGQTISGAMTSERRAQIAQRLRGTAQDILEGRRFARRQKKRDSQNSPQLSQDEIDFTRKLINGQIDGILAILEDDQRGRQYIADTVNAMNDSIQNVSPRFPTTTHFAIQLSEITGLPGKPNPDFPHKATHPSQKYIPYSASDFGLEDLATFRAALSALKNKRPFQEQNWGRFSQLLKVYATTMSDFDGPRPVKTNSRVIENDIPFLYMPEVINTNEMPFYRLPELWVDSGASLLVGQHPQTEPLFKNRPLEELKEVNNLYATIGLLMMDARGTTTHRDRTVAADLRPETIDSIAQLYMAQVPQSKITEIPNSGGSGSLDRTRQAYVDYYREFLAGNRVFNQGASSQLTTGLLKVHRDDMRIFFHNLWHGQTLWNSPKKEKNNDEKINTRNSIVERFIRGLSPSRDRQSGTIQRELRGRVPRSTTRLRERIAMRSRRRARIQAGEIQSFDDAPKFEQPKVNRPESPGGPRRLEEFLEPLPAFGTPARASERWATRSENGILLTDEKGRQKLDPILRDFADHIQPDIDDPATRAAIRRQDWSNPQDAQNSANRAAVAGLDDLDRFFRDEVNHAAIARLREGALNPYDVEHQDELRKIYNDWLMLFNDPEQDPVPGTPSNMRLTEVTTSPWVMLGEPGFLQDDMDEAWRTALKKRTIRMPIRQAMTTVGERVVLRAATPGKPVVYVEDSEAQVAHLMTPEGKHLMSLVTSRPDENGKSDLFFIAGSDALRQIEEKKFNQTLSQRIKKLLPRERRRAAALSRASIKRRSPLSIDLYEPGTKFGATSTGPLLTQNAQAAMDEATLSQMVKSIEDNLDILENNIRRELDFPDTKQPISTAEAVARIAEIGKISPRRASIIETDLHNMVALARAQETGDINYLNDLKPGLRSKMLAGLSSDLLSNTDGSKKRFAVTPHETRLSKRPRPKITKIPRHAPVIVSESTLAPEPSKITTGPELTPGVGNPGLGIDYDKLSGLYIDTATGEYIEDYSGLPIEQTAIFEPIPPQDGLNYPRVIVSPPGILPSRFATLAPGTNPDNSVRPGDVHTPTFREAINAFVQSILARKKKTPASQVVDKILQKQDISTRLRGSLLAMIDARGWKVQIPGQEKLNLEDPYFQHQLGLMTFGEIQDLANQSIEQNPNLPLVDLGISYADSLATVDTMVNSVIGRDVLSQQLPNQRGGLIDGLGLDMQMEPSIFYLPGENIGNSFINDEFLSSINRALQLQHAVESLSEKISSEKFTPDDPNNPAEVARTSDYVNAKKEQLIEMREEASNAWAKAAEILSQTYADASNERNKAAEQLSNNPRNAKAMEEYLRYGAQAEAAKMLLDRHITSNPAALAALQKTGRAKLEALAKARNARRRAQLERAKARAGRAIPRNEGAFDNNPEILDPHGTANPPSTPRPVDEIFDVLQQHRSEGLFDDPTLGLTPLADEQITALAQLDELQKKNAAAVLNQGDGSAPNMFTGIEGTPLYGIDFIGSTDMDTLHDVQVAHFWYVNGASSLPVLVSKEEMEKLLTELDSDGNRRAVAILRGVKSESLPSAREDAAQEEEWVNMALRGDRFVPGRGGKLSGHGEYWALNPNRWATHHGQAGTMLGVITEKSQLFHGDAFRGFFPTMRGNLYEALWGLYNAIGAPGSQGVNRHHGQNVAQLVPPSSLTPDPKTGQFSPAQIAKLEDVVAQLTAVGPDISATKSGGIVVGDEWGALTLEGMRRDIVSNGRGEITIWDQIFEDKTTTPDTPENIKIIEETQALRQKINSWYAQHLSWFVQLAQMRQDESQAGQAGIDAKAYNEKLVAALRSILYLRSESRASMLGIDAFVQDFSQVFLPSRVWKALSDLDDPQGDRILVLNRSGMIYLRSGIRGYDSAVDIVQPLTIQTPDGRSIPPTIGRRW